MTKNLKEDLNTILDALENKCCDRRYIEGKLNKWILHAEDVDKRLTDCYRREEKIEQYIYEIRTLL